MSATNMKAIIDGKRYNTETATLVAETANGHDTANFHFELERLYRTKNAAWFIAGEGGPYSSYAHREGNTQYGGKAIRPLSQADALNWLEQHEQTEAIETYFGAHIHDA